MKGVYETADFYSREAAQYDTLRWGHAAGTYTDAVQKAIVDQLLGNLQCRELLEIGAGTGRFATHLAEMGAKVTALDISLSMLKYANCVLSTDCSLIQADAIYLPFEANSFDRCLSVNVFSHVANYKVALQEIARVLRPGGFFVVNFPNLWSYYLPAGVLVNVRRRALRRNVYTHWYTLRSFRLACRQAGLILERIVGQIHLPGTVAQPGFNAVLRRLDQLSRGSSLRYLCPTLFVKAVKTGGILAGFRG